MSRFFLSAFLTLGCIASLSVSAAHAQATLPSASTAPASQEDQGQVIKLLPNNRVRLHFTGLTSVFVLQQLMEQRKAPYAIGSDKPAFITVRAENITLDQALDLICEVAVPRMEWKVNGGIYRFTIAAPQVLNPASVRAASAPPNEDELTTAMILASPDRMDALLELKLVRLQKTRTSLLNDGWLPKARKVKQVEADILATRQAIQARQKSHKTPPERTASVTRRRLVHTRQGE